jgi:tRNA dimethylallyltransferase
MGLPKIIVIVGATASGKTGLGIRVAREIDGEVISVDSRQVYRGMDVGTAKPDGSQVRRVAGAQEHIGQLFGQEHHLEVEGIPHWGIDLVNPDEEYSVADFKGYAERKIKEIHRRGHTPLLVGGTGMWIWAVIDNLLLTETPSDPKLRAELDMRHIDDLYAEYKRLDPEGAETIDRENKRRVVRALEVTRLTGKPFSQQLTRGPQKYDVLQIGLQLEREELYRRIDERVEGMVAMGLVNEVRSLRDKYGCDIESMTGIGYRQVCRFLEGEQSLADAIEDVKRDTRRYAKRQATWFKRDPRIHWVTNEEEAMETVVRWLEKKAPA